MAMIREVEVPGEVSKEEEVQVGGEVGVGGVREEVEEGREGAGGDVACRSFPGLLRLR